MKKYLVALVVALMVSFVSIPATASAELDSYVERYGTSHAAEDYSIEQAYAKAMSEVDSEHLDIRERIKIITEAYEEAGWTVIQETPEMTRSVDIDPEILELAYSDIDEDDPVQKGKIIDARETVINQYSWHNDIEAPDCVSYMVDSLEHVITFSPLYSELFPGWDPPRHVQTEEDNMEYAGSVGGIVGSIINGVMRAQRSTLYYDGNCTVPAAGSTGAPSFCSVYIEQAYKNKIETAATRSYTNGLNQINIGYNTKSGERVATRTRVPIGYSFTVEPGPNYIYSRLNPCVSTYDTPGTVYMQVRRTLIMP